MSFPFNDQQQTEILASLLFPKVCKTPQDLETAFPPRQLPDGAKVTRFAPSPTGFVHFGGLFPAMVAERLAHQSQGVFYLRIEDTDAKREVPGAAAALINTLAHYGILFDEGCVLNDDREITDKGAYGPYRQSMRADIYHVYAKELVRRGLAYPCFSTDEELEQLQSQDKKAEIKSIEWSEDYSREQHEKMLAQRDFTLDDVRKELDQGHNFVLRIRADGDPDKKIPFTDLVRGNLELPENDEDFVLLKSDGIPTYHFAHAVDDHLMGTTHVIRGEEWLPSLPKHLQLFRYLGFRMPKYMHIAQIMRLDENGNKKKLSKRDMGANLNDYERMGYAAQSVCEYVMTLLNSNYEEWRAQNPDRAYTDFPFSIKKMSSSGCLFDFNKLNDISKNVISQMSAETVYTNLLNWAGAYDTDFAESLSADPAYAISILSIGRGGKKPRKDIVSWADAKPYMGFFYDKYFRQEDAFPSSFPRQDIQTVLQQFASTYDEHDPMDVWFEKIKTISESIGYTADMKAYKASPESFRGSVADASMFLRLAVTGRLNSPDMYTVMQILGRERVLQRISDAAKSLS